MAKTTQTDDLVSPDVQQTPEALTTPPTSKTATSAYFKVFVIGAAALLVLFILPNKAPLMMISAESRGLTFDVSNSDETTIRFLEDVAIITKPNQEPVCATGLLVPANESAVTYNVVQNSLLIQSRSDNVQPPLQFIKDGERSAAIPITNGGYLYYGMNSPCEVDRYRPIRLPIWGTTKLGVVPTPPTQSKSVDGIGSIILSGDVKVFGRNIFGSGLYPAGEFSLPAGSQLYNDRDGRKTLPNPWHGFAIYDPHQNGVVSNAFMVVSASTIADRLHLKRLGGGPIAEKIDVSVLTKIFGDPLLSGIGAFFAFLFFFSEFILAIRSLRRES